MSPHAAFSQTSGYGLAPPGNLFSYDSDVYIQELSALLRVTAGRQHNGSAAAFAEHAFAAPLGVPGLYEFDGVGKDISAGGGQMATCREIARAGQLLLNQGKWLDENGQPQQLIDEAYTRQLFQPAKPGVVEGYGFLLWLNTDMARHDGKSASGEVPGRSHCCGPRWIGNLTHSPLGRESCTAVGPAPELCGVCCVPRPGSEPLACDPSLPVLLEGAHTDADRDPAEHVTNQIIGDSFPVADRPEPGPFSPPDLAMAMGAYAKYMFLSPETNTLVCSTRPVCLAHQCVRLTLSGSVSGREHGLHFWQKHGLPRWLR